MFSIEKSDILLKVLIVLLIIVIVVSLLKRISVLQRMLGQQVSTVENFTNYDNFWSHEESFFNRFYQRERFVDLPNAENGMQNELSPEDKASIKELQRRIKQFVQSQIKNPIEGTDSDRWQFILNNKLNNIQGLNKFEQYIQHQFAYTKNKGDLIKLCLSDEQGVLNVDLNMYVLLHELTHIYDPKYLPGKHDEYFWILFSKIIKRAISEQLIDPSIFAKNQCRCKTKIINANDIDVIERKCAEELPVRDVDSQ